MSTPSLLSTIKRILPGYSWKKPNATQDVIFLKGRVLHAGWGQTGSVTQTIETDSKLVPLVKLIGDTYAYWCGNCKATIWEQELIEHRSKVQHWSASVTEQKCPYCTGPISPLQPGDKVRLHYRFSPKGQWGGWWAERWEW